MSLKHSDAGRWVFCAASAAPFPRREQTDSAKEGEAVHWIAADTLDTATPSKVYPATAPNGVLITDEMLQAAFEYADVIESRGLPPMVEMPVPSERIDPESLGIPDCWQYDPDQGVLYLDDLKYGRTVVEVFENWQMIADACGVLDLLGIDGRTDEFTRVCFTVHQPRARHVDGPVRTWQVRASDLRPYFNRLALAAKNVREYPRHATGPHCLNCPRRHTCPSAERAAMAAFEYVADLRTETLTSEALGRELLLLEAAEAAIKARKTGLEVDATDRLKRGGEAVPGWTLKQTYGRLSWAVPVAEVVTMGSFLGLDLAKPQDAITPTQAKALAKKQGVDESVITAYAASVGTGTALVRDTQLNRQIQQAFKK